MCVCVKMCVFMCVCNGSHGSVRPRAGSARLQMSSGAVAPAKPYAEVLSAVEGQVAPKWDAGAAEIFAAMEDLKAAGVMSAGTAPRYIYVYTYLCLYIIHMCVCMYLYMYTNIQIDRYICR